MKSLVKQTRHARIVLLVLLVFAAGFALGSQGLNNPVEAQGRVDVSDTNTAFEPLWEAYAILQSRYVDPIDVERLVEGAISGMVNALDDPYSSYMRPQVYAMFNSDLSGNVEGIGVVITTRDNGEIQVVTVIPGAPAMDAGVMPGDVFIEVDGESVAGFDQTELAAVVRGPAGTQVNITFRRGQELVNFTITRARFAVPNVSYEVLEGNIAYISMLDFNQVTRSQLDDALAAVDVNNRIGLIFDLRGNPGGLLSSAIDVGSAFIESGPILLETFSIDGQEQMQVFEANGNFAGIQVPIVVLIDETSASASELLAGAMQDTGAAIVLGEPSVGKGSVQTIQPLSNGGGLRLTIAYWLTPNGNSIHQQGVQPDIVVEWTPESFDDPDLQLEAAVDYLLSLGE